MNRCLLRLLIFLVKLTALIYYTPQVGKNEPQECPEDVLPKKKKRKKRTTPAAKATGKSAEKGEKEKQTCPYCGKEFQRLGRHINTCPKRPTDEEEDEEEDTN